MRKHISALFTATLLSAVSLAVAGQSTSVAPQEDENDSDWLKYHEFAVGMAYWGYSWESFELTTDDGFILTTFHVTGKRDQTPVERDESLNPIVLMHGQACDATAWVGAGDRHIPPLPFRLFDRGFDIYLASNRGTKYCQQHTSLEMEDPEYWAWSWAEMGIYDDVANIKFVKERTGKKVSYVGVSQGTVQMFYALAKLEEDFFADNLFTFAALDPCTIQVDEGQHLYTDGLFHLEDYGIYAFGGPDWDANLKIICDNFEQDICDWAADYGGGEPFSVQDYLHWAQNVIENRFQEFAPNYLQGETKTDLIDLSQIKTVPVTIWSGLLDDVCAHSQAVITNEEIGERATYFRTVPWGDHYYWGGPLADGLYEELEARLINPEKKSYPLNSNVWSKFMQ